MFFEKAGSFSVSSSFIAHCTVVDAIFQAGVFDTLLAESVPLIHSTPSYMSVCHVVGVVIWILFKSPRFGIYIGFVLSTPFIAWEYDTRATGAFIFGADGFVVVYPPATVGEA